MPYRRTLPYGRMPWSRVSLCIYIYIMFILFKPKRQTWIKKSIEFFIIYDSNDNKMIKWQSKIQINFRYFGFLRPPEIMFACGSVRSFVIFCHSIHTLVLSQSPNSGLSFSTSFWRDLCEYSSSSWSHPPHLPLVQSSPKSQSQPLSWQRTSSDPSGQSCKESCRFRFSAI